MTAEETKAYFQKLAQDTGLDESQRAAILQALENEKFAKQIADDHKRQSDYSREMDRLRKEDADRKAWLEAEAAKVQQWETFHKQNEARLRAAQEYERLYGPLENANGNHVQQQTGLTKEEIAKIIDERISPLAGTFGQLVQSIPEMALDYYDRFKEKPNLQEFAKFAEERKLPADLAYREWIAPKVEAQRTAEWEAKLKAAREDGYKDGYSKARVPQDGNPRESSTPGVLDVALNSDLRKLSPYDQERAARDAFFTGLTEAELKKTGT